MRTTAFPAFAATVLGAILFTSGCMGLNIGTGGGGDAGSATSGSGPDGGGSQGVDCVTESTTGATICTGNSACPSVAVDHDVYPDCGYRVVGANATLDIECACQDGMLCPVGIASTCAEASQMLQDQTESTVCQQVSEGRCSKGTGTGSTGGSSAQSNCNADCEQKCAGAPACIAECGC